MNHAEDRWLFVDPLVWPLVEKLSPGLAAVERLVVMSDAAHMPATGLANVVCYEDLLASESDRVDWPRLDENTASTLCYTSGTTGNGGGVRGRSAPYRDREAEQAGAARAVQGLPVSGSMSGAAAWLAC